MDSEIFILFFQKKLELVFDEGGLFDEVTFVRRKRLPESVKRGNPLEFDEFTKCAIEVAYEFSHALNIGRRQEIEIF